MGCARQGDGMGRCAYAASGCIPPRAEATIHRAPGAPACAAPASACLTGPQPQRRMAKSGERSRTDKNETARLKGRAARPAKPGLITFGDLIIPDKPLSVKPEAVVSGNGGA